MFFNSRETTDLITKEKLIVWDEIQGDNSYWAKRKRNDWSDLTEIYPRPGGVQYRRSSTASISPKK